MLRKIKLYGELAEFIGHKEFEVKVDSLPKAISFLINNFPKVEQYMNPKYYQVKVGDYAISEEEIHNPIGQEDIHFVPVIVGAGGGLGRALLGAAMIGLAFATAGASVAAAGGLLSTGGFAAASFGTKALLLGGGALLLGGVTDMLFPMPKPQEFSSESDPRLSFSFSGTQNTSRAGTPVPICYGEIVTGSVVISGAVDTQQVQA
tara:strand:- start:438 stop:1052 length:615 start_codon:yes stop_codon:yes gene_type:complete